MTVSDAIPSSWKPFHELLTKLGGRRPCKNLRRPGPILSNSIHSSCQFHLLGGLLGTRQVAAPLLAMGMTNSRLAVDSSVGSGVRGLSCRATQVQDTL